LQAVERLLIHPTVSTPHLLKVFLSCLVILSQGASLGRRVRFSRIPSCDVVLRLMWIIVVDYLHFFVSSNIRPLRDVDDDLVPRLALLTLQLEVAAHNDHNDHYDED